MKRKMSDFEPIIPSNYFQKPYGPSGGQQGDDYFINPD